LISQSDAGFPHEIDHVISRKHGGISDLENMAFACYVCNQQKGSDIASIQPVSLDLVRLFHPRRDGWKDYFRMVGPLLEPLTAIGEATAQVLRFNVAVRVIERQLLQSLGRYPRA
jgi:hypothetical protein